MTYLFSWYRKCTKYEGRPDPFLWIAAFVADAATVNPNGIETLLANRFNIFFIKGKPVFSNGPRSLPKNTPDYLVLFNWVFDNFILADWLFAKALRSFEIYVLVNNNLCKKLSSSLESSTTFDESFKVTSVPFLILDFNLLNCELDNFAFKVLYWVILYWYYIKAK